jgi:hypothetical protein
LKTATGLNPYCCGWKYGVRFSLTRPLFNIISGRTAMLKKELKVEKKEI